MQNAAQALLVMDMQGLILSGYTDTSSIIQNIKTCIDKARATQIPIIYVVLKFRPGLPEVGDQDPYFTAVKERLGDADWDQLTAIPEPIAPQDRDLIVTKKRFSAFTGSDLEVILRAKNIRHLVLTGIATSGVVLSTYTQAADMDYQLTVIADACKDRSDDLHEALITHYFPKKGIVTTSEDWTPTSL